MIFLRFFIYGCLTTYTLLFATVTDYPHKHLDYMAIVVFGGILFMTSLGSAKLLKKIFLELSRRP